MGAIAAWWNSFGYRIFPFHQKQLDNINKMLLDLIGKLAQEQQQSLALKEEIAAALLASDALRAKLAAAESAHRRAPEPQKAKTAAEVRRLMELATGTEGEGDGV